MEERSLILLGSVILFLLALFLIMFVGRKALALLQVI